MDQFLGSGTTLIEAKLLNRNAIGVDINPQAIELARNNLEFDVQKSPRIELRNGTATELDFLKDNSIDLICTHPPYADIIHYSRDISGDLSRLPFIQFEQEMEKVASEAYRVLKPKKICAYMIGDIRVHGNVIPLGFETMGIFCKKGFALKEIVIKEQHNCRSSRYWEDKKRSFLLLAHEYIFVLEKS